MTFITAFVLTLALFGLAGYLVGPATKKPESIGAGIAFGVVVYIIGLFGFHNPRDQGLAIVMLLGLVVQASIGSMIGSRLRNDPVLGFTLGTVLGVIGWIVIAVTADNRRKCPHCRGVVPDDAKVCMHCARELG